MKPDYKLSRPIFRNASPLIFKRAKELRINRTEAEIKLWEYLKEHKFKGLKFRQQHPIGSYILDFYCHKLKIAIELDGSMHNNLDQKIYDEERTFELNEFGIDVIRFWNNEVITEMDFVINRLNEFVELKLQDKL